MFDGNICALFCSICETQWREEEEEEEATEWCCMHECVTNLEGNDHLGVRIIINSYCYWNPFLISMP